MLSVYLKGEMANIFRPAYYTLMQLTEDPQSYVERSLLICM